MDEVPKLAITSLGFYLQPLLLSVLSTTSKDEDMGIEQFYPVQYIIVSATIEVPSTNSILPSSCNESICIFILD